jgi:hypothetical protein
MSFDLLSACCLFRVSVSTKCWILTSILTQAPSLENVQSNGSKESQIKWVQLFKFKFRKKTVSSVCSSHHNLAWVTTSLTAPPVYLHSILVDVGLASFDPLSKDRE